MSIALMIIQLAVDALLVILLAVIWRRTGRGAADPAALPENFNKSLENFLEEAEKISETFARNLREKKELSADLILKLDRRLSDYQALLKRTEASLAAARKKLSAAQEDTAGPGKANPAAPEVRALVLQLSKKGCPPEEIAAKAHLHLGEVELIIDLERQFSV